MGFVGSAQMCMFVRRLDGLLLLTLLADYSASKAALLNMHESLRYELDNRYVQPSIGWRLSTFSIL